MTILLYRKIGISQNWRERCNSVLTNETIRVFPIHTKLTFKTPLAPYYNDFILMYISFSAEILLCCMHVTFVKFSSNRDKVASG